MDADGPHAHADLDRHLLHELRIETSSPGQRDGEDRGGPGGEPGQALDAVLSHNRFTLVDRSAEPLMDDADRRGVAFVNGAPYGGGMLAKGPDVQPKYAYRLAGQAVQGAVRAMQRACAAQGVSLAAAALQFSLRDPRVASTVVGVSEPSRIKEITALMSEQIPAGLWAELDSLSVAPEFWLN